MITQATFTKHPSNALRMPPVKAAINEHILKVRHKLAIKPIVCEHGASVFLTVKHGDIDVYLSELVELKKHVYTSNPLVSLSYRGLL